MTILLQPYKVLQGCYNLEISIWEVNINALLLQTVLYQNWGHAVMDDIIYKTKKHVLILIVFQDSIFWLIV